MQPVPDDDKKPEDAQPPDFSSGDAFVAYYCQKADKTIRAAEANRKAAEEGIKAAEAGRKAADSRRTAAEERIKRKTLKFADAGYEEEQREALTLGYVTSTEARERGWTVTTLS